MGRGLRKRARAILLIVFLLFLGWGSLALLLHSDILRVLSIRGIARIISLADSDAPLFPLSIYNDPWGKLPSLPPNRCQLFDGYAVRIPPTRICGNAAGFRDYNYTVEKPSGVFRVVMLGDSFVFGWGVELEDTLPKKLEDILNEGKTSYSYQVLNFGFPGLGTEEEVEMLKLRAVRYDPDMVIILFLPDDFSNESIVRDLYEAKIAEYLQKYPYRSYERAERDVSLDVAIQRDSMAAGESVDSLRARMLPVLQDLAGISSRENFSVLFAIDNWNPNQETFLRQATQELHFELVSLHPESHPDYDPSRMVGHPLDGHPSALANRIKAELLFREMVERGLI